MNFYPYEKGGGAEKVLTMLKGGHNKFWGSFYAVARSFSHIERGHKRFPLFKREERKVLPCLEWGGERKRFRTRDFPVV